MLEERLASLRAFLKETGLPLKNYERLNIALTHASYTNEHHMPPTLNYERLEFLGDAVLQVIVTERLFLSKECDNEGQMTKLRAAMVCEPSLAELGRKINLGPYILFGHGEEEDGPDKDSNLCDVVEALIAAIYLEAGMGAVKDFLAPHLDFLEAEAEHTKYYNDYKSKILEYAQSFEPKRKVLFPLLKEEGPSHAPFFTVAVTVDGVQKAVATCHSKKKAEQEAAQKALQRLHQEDSKASS